MKDIKLEERKKELVDEFGKIEKEKIKFITESNKKVAKMNKTQNMLRGALEEIEFLLQASKQGVKIE